MTEPKPDTLREEIEREMRATLPEWEREDGTVQMWLDNAVSVAHRIARQTEGELLGLLRVALTHAQEHQTGCLYCGEDENYVDEHAETSPAHQATCWYYRAEARCADRQQPQQTEGD